MKYLRYLFAGSCLTALGEASLLRRPSSPLNVHEGVLAATRSLPLRQGQRDSVLLRLRGGSAVSESVVSSRPLLFSLKGVLMPAVGLSSLVWFVFAWEIHRQRGAITEKEMISKHLKAHRQEKVQSVQDTLVPMLLILSFLSVFTRSLPWHAEFWKEGPPALALGLNFAFWVAEITMDSALDELGALKMGTSTTFTDLLQLGLIVYLTNRRTGHIIFVFKATETILATSLARVVDHPYWTFIAVASTLFFAAAFSTGYLAPLPVEFIPAAAYFAATLMASTAYQIIQNSLGFRLRNVKLFRAAACCIAVATAGTPPSWILYDVINFLLFFVFKIVTDTVGICALR